jgi:ketosteroid isomerase-like protein
MPHGHEHKEMMMTTQVREVADELVELCRQGKNLEAVDRFYSPDIVSTEAAEMGGMPRVVRGQAGVRAKNEAWVKDTKVHSSELRGPFPHGEDQFAVYAQYEVTPKTTGKKMKMEEVGVYTVRNGKIVEERFFYSM